MTWYRRYGLIADPYDVPDPRLINEARLGWNRMDLPEQRKTIDHFIEDLEGAYKTGLLAWGPIGAGKTWLGKIIDDEYRAKVSDGVVFYTKITNVDPSFDAVYGLFIDSFLASPALPKLVQVLDVPAGPWAELFPNEDLGRALHDIAIKSRTKEVAKNWLRGLTVSARELKEAGISMKLESYQQELDVMTSLIRKCVELFPGVLLIVDELENAAPPLARQFGDALRELLDSFVDKFSLCCLFTAQSLSEWYDNGYSEAVLSRLRYKVQLESLSPKTAPDWLRQHHTRYRDSEATFQGDQLLPFTSDGLTEMLGMMDPGKVYPRYVLLNCGHMARELQDPNETIDASFVKKYAGRLENRQAPAT